MLERGITAGTWRWLSVKYFAECADYLRLDERTQRVRRGIIEATFDEPIAPGSPSFFRDMPLMRMTEDAIEVQGVASREHRNVSSCFGIQGPSPLRDAARFRARSTSHAVAAHSSCTKIPLSAGRAQEDENHSRKRHFRPWLATVRLPGSARTDQVLGDDGITLVYSLGNLHRNAFDNDTGGHVFPERDQ